MNRIPIAIIALLLAAACGTQPASSGVASVKGTGTPASASASPSASVDQDEQARKFAQCMRDNGIDMPDPEPGQKGALAKLIHGDIDDARLKKAMKACEQYNPFGERHELNPEQLEAMRQFAQCMRDNGVDMPDPSPDGLSKPSGSTVDRSDPKVKKAVEACQDKLAKVRGD